MDARFDTAHLSQKHRDTLDHLERHPTTHNLAWDDVLGLLREIADVTKESGETYRVTLGGHHVVVSQPTHDAVDEKTALELHRLLTDAGFTQSGD